MNYSSLLQDIARARVNQAEERVAILILQGVNPMAIADQLHLSPRTVRNHLRSIYKKCEVAGKCELTAKALSAVMQKQGAKA